LIWFNEASNTAVARETAGGLLLFWNRFIALHDLPRAIERVFARAGITVVFSR
jgi:hypothetical protein